MKKEFKLLATVVAQYLPPEYPYDVVAGARNIKQADFHDDRDWETSFVYCRHYT